MPDMPVPAARGKTWNKTPRVLIVEDEGMIAWDMSLSLEAAGLEVIGIVATGAAALESLADGPDVVLMDVRLKEGPDGLETARAIRERGAGPAIIIITGFGDPDTAARIRAINPDAYVLKPVMPEELVQAIRQVLKSGSI